MGLEKFFAAPKDGRSLFCKSYPPRTPTEHLKTEMQDIKKTPKEEIKKKPLKWPKNPCYKKNHHFNVKLDLRTGPAMVPEQVHEYLLMENHAYHTKILTVKEKYVRAMINDPFFEEAASGYWHVTFLPIIYPDIVLRTKKEELDKQGFFCLAKFHADFLKLGLEQMLLDETILGGYNDTELKEVYQAHNRLRCLIELSMARLNMKPTVFNYKRAISKFRYREIASRPITNLRTFITLRSCYLLSLFVWRVLYVYRFDAK